MYFIVGASIQSMQQNQNSSVFLLFICQSFITMSHSWDELGFIAGSERKKASVKKTLNLPSEALNDCVWNVAGIQ